MTVLRDKVVLVTGAGKGIGRSIAKRFADAGASLVLAARTIDDIEQLAKDIVVAGGRAVAVSADVGDAAAVDDLVRRAEAELGRVDVLINNAARGGPLGPVAHVDIEDWVATIHVNLIGPVRLTRALLPGMLERRWGRIVNLSSGAARSGGAAGQNAYATSKGGLETFTLKLAIELEGTGVTVNALRPGASDTPMQTWMREQDPAVVGEHLSSIFRTMAREGLLKDPDLPARETVALVESEDNGAIVEMVRSKHGDELIDTVDTLRSIG